MDNEKISRKEELIKKYGIDLKKLEDEQIKLAKILEIKDKIDLNKVNYIGVIETILVKNKIISAMVVFDKDYEVIDQEYFLDKIRFPYLHGFKAYRELASMAAVFNKIREKPDILLIKGEGINHPRLGIASHLSIAVNMPVIGVEDKLFEENEVKGEEVFMNGKIVGKKLITKKGAKPIYILPGNHVSVEGAYEFVKGLIVQPHKMPEPIYLTHRYAKDIKNELKLD